MGDENIISNCIDKIYRNSKSIGFYMSAIGTGLFSKVFVESLTTFGLKYKAITEKTYSLYDKLTPENLEKANATITNLSKTLSGDYQIMVISAISTAFFGFSTWYLGNKNLIDYKRSRNDKGVGKTLDDNL